MYRFIIVNNDNFVNYNKKLLLESHKIRIYYYNLAYLKNNVTKCINNCTLSINMIINIYNNRILLYNSNKKKLSYKENK